MKKMTKKFLAIILVTILLVAQFSFFTNISMAATTVQDLRNKFPAGAYWNGGNADGYTYTPCYHNPQTGEGENCNYCDGAWQCAGFAFKLFRDYYGVGAKDNASYGDYLDVSSLKPGDAIQYFGPYTDQYYGHTVWIIGMDENNYYVADCNSDNHCIIRWDATLPKSQVSNVKAIYKAPSEINDFVDTEAPVVGNVSVSEKNKEGFTITADVSDDVGVTKVSFYVTVNGKEITFNAPSISDGKASVRINYADYGLTEGTSTATANIRAYDAAGKTSNTGNIGTVNIDLNDPVISNVEVSDVTGTGYVLTFEVSDNVGVTKVQCPTWNESNDRDEMEGSNWETNPEYTAIEKAGVYTYHVNIDNDTFQNEGGTYKTQITAFDEYGNTVQENVEVEVYPITDVTLNESEATIYKGQELVLEATYEPENTTGDTEVTWTSSDEEVATVKDGVVTALKEGTTTITATIDGVEATCELTVKEIPLGSIEIEEQNVSLNVGEEKDLHVLYNPEDTTDDKTVVWTSSDESVITVSEDGKVKALKAGKATITATVGDKTATTEIVVNEEQETGTSVLPKTGDMQVVLLALGMVISAAGIIFIIKKNRK